MNKVFIVKRVWWYEGPSDNFGNCYEENILKIFNNEEKAVEYIRDLIKYKVDKYSTDPRLCDEYVNEVPPASSIVEGERIVYHNNGWDEYSSYVYDGYEVN